MEGMVLLQQVPRPQGFQPAQPAFPTTEDTGYCKLMTRSGMAGLPPVRFMTVDAKLSLSHGSLTAPAFEPTQNGVHVFWHIDEFLHFRISCRRTALERFRNRWVGCSSLGMRDEFTSSARFCTLNEM